MRTMGAGTGLLYGPDGRELLHVMEERDSLVDVTRQFTSGADGKATPVSPSQAYSKTSMVYACTNAIGNTVAQLPFVTEKNGREVESPDPIYELFRRPSPGVSTFTLWFGAIASLELAGNAVWEVKTTSQGAPTQIVPLNPRLVRPKLTRDDSALIGYNLQEKYGSRFLPYEKAIHFKYWNDKSPFWGMSTVTAAMLSITTDQKARSYNAAFFDNSATLGGLLIAKDQTPKKARETGEYINEKHQSSARAHRTLVLGGEYAYYQIGIGQKDMDFLGMLNDARDTMGAVFNVPGILTNNPNNRNFATAWAELRIFHLTNWGPKLKYIESELDAQFYDRYAPGYSGYFDKEDAPGVGADMDDVIERAKSLWQMGTPYNELIRMLDLPLKQRPWGEVWYMPTNLAPAGPVSGQEDDPEDDPEPEGDLNPEDNSFENGEIRGTGGDLRVEYWSAFDSVCRGMSGDFEQSVHRHFGRLRAETLANLADFGISDPNGVVFRLDAADSALSEISREAFEAAMVDGGNQACSDLEVDMDFRITVGDSARLLAEQSAEFIRINRTVRDAVVAAVTGAGSDDEAIAAVKKVFSAADRRSKVIAAFEVRRAVNSGKFVAMAERRVHKIEWVSSQRGSSSARHPIDGEVVELGVEFSVGLKYPGDHSGSGSSADNLIGCGCTILPVRAGEE